MESGYMKKNQTEPVYKEYPRFRFPGFGSEVRASYGSGYDQAGWLSSAVSSSNITVRQ